MSDALDAMLDEALPQHEVPEQVTDYWVTDLLTADKALGRVAKLDAELNRITDAADDKIARIEQWRTAECERLRQRRAYYEQLLAHFHASVLDDDPKAKTIRVSNGSLVARKQADNIDIPEPTLVTVWLLKNNPQLLRHRDPELDRSAVKRAVMNDGEVIPGVKIVPGEVKFSVSPN